MTDVFNRRKKILIIKGLFLLLLVTGNRLFAQQQAAFSFTQYMDNLTPLNPAYSLLDKAGSVNTLARKQWVGIDGAPTTFLVNANLPIESINGAAGIIIFNDQFAIEHQTEANAYFAKAIQLGQNDFLSVSLNAGLRNYVANYSLVAPTDPTFGNDVRQTKPNIGFGVMYFTDWYYIGVSVPELTINSLGTASVQNNTNFTNHYYLAGALLTSLSEDIRFKPAALFSYSKGTPTTGDFSGILYLKDVLGVGFNYRTNNQAAGILTINIDTVHIGYSYQFGTSSNNLGFNVPTHEVTLNFRFGKSASIPKLL